MRFSDPVKIAYKNIVAAKFRSFLTILGIVIGIASVIIIIAIGSSAQELILDQVKGVGSNLIGVLPGASEEKGPPASAMGVIITTLKYDDLKAILQKTTFLTRLRERPISAETILFNMRTRTKIILSREQLPAI
jgi:putative ABC transport system permease protein